MVWSSLDAFGLLNIIAFTFVQPFQSRYGKGMQWYDQINARVTPRIPRAWFGPIWLVMYSLISASVFIFFSEDFGFAVDQPLYIAGYVLYVVNIVLNKIWSPLFFSRRIGLALLVLLLLIGTGIGLLIVFGLSAAWLSFGLYAAYVLWSMVALVLNIQFYNIHTELSRYSAYLAQK